MKLWRWIRALLGVSALVGLTVGGYYAYAELDRPVTQVVIVGQVDPAERAQIERVVDGHLARGVLTADIPAIREGLLGLGWTRDVRVRRVWPDKIEVALEHSTPIAYWNRTRLLGDDGRTYPFVGQSVDAELPHLYGGQAHAADVVSHFKMLRELFGPSGLELTRAGRDAKGNWSLQLDRRIDVHLGNRDVLERARRVVDLYTRHLRAERDRIARIDGRYANGVAVAWIPAAAPAEPTDVVATTDEQNNTVAAVAPPPASAAVAATNLE